VTQQLNALRDRYAELVDSPHPLTRDDYATIDIAGSIDGEPMEGLVANDYLYMVGANSVVPELDDNLLGTKPGEILEFSSTLPESAGERAGQVVDFRVVVKEAKQKQLPELTDEWAAEASEFDTIDELRADIAKRVDLMARLQGTMAAREKVLEAAADLVPIEAPEPLVEDEVRARINDFAHRLSHQGLSIDQWFESTGQDPQAFIDESREQAKRAILADLALRSVVKQEELEVADDEIEAEVERLATRFSWKKKDRRNFEQNGGVEAVRSDLARNKAVKFLIDHAQVVDEHGNELDLALPEGTEVPEPEDDDEIDFEDADGDN
jgi:trigger factor